MEGVDLDGGLGGSGKGCALAALVSRAKTTKGGRVQEEVLLVLALVLLYNLVAAADEAVGCR